MSMPDFFRSGLASIPAHGYEQDYVKPGELNGSAHENLSPDRRSEIQEFDTKLIDGIRRFDHSQSGLASV